MNDYTQRLILSIEILPLPLGCRKAILPFLREVIIEHGHISSPDTITFVGSAVRKYVSCLPMEDMGQLTSLLENSCFDIQFEIIKMIDRNYKVLPPKYNTEPDLSKAIWDLLLCWVKTNQFDKFRHGTWAMLSCEALIAMRSGLSTAAYNIACTRVKWFSELVDRHLDDIYEIWSTKDQEAAKWLNEIRCEFIGR